jgi:dTDP-4-dehydrorhamnose 3,5-epimerase
MLSALNIPAPLLIEFEKLEDDRSFLRYSWSGGFARKTPSGVSFTRHRGTLRGLHFQAAPHEEIKIVRCTRGTIFDVVVDLRPGSPTRAKWVGVGHRPGDLYQNSRTLTHA